MQNIDLSKPLSGNARFVLKGTLLTICLALAGMLAIPAAQAGAPPAKLALDCAGEYEAVKCVANDIVINSVTVIPNGPNCNEGDDVVVNLQLETQLNANNRFDGGIWIGEDGNDPRGTLGGCFVTPWPDNPNIPEILDIDGDSCPDNNAKDTPVTQNIGPLTIECADNFSPGADPNDPDDVVAGGDGLLDIFTLVTWWQQEGNVCTGAADIRPSGKPKCDTIFVSAPITVIPDPDSISLVKNASPSTYTQAGDVISYTYDVTNDGANDLAGPVTIDDDLATDESCPNVNTVGDNDGDLDVGETIQCTASYQITGGDVAAESVTNTADATVDGVDSNQDQETVTLEPTVETSLASFHVTKDFLPDNDMEVEVAIKCDDGLPLNSSQDIIEDSDGVVFIVELFTPGNLDCEIIETSVPGGYSVLYEADSGNDGVAGSISDPNGVMCEFEEVEGGDFTCEITNSADDVTFKVHKEWDVIGEGGDQIPQVAGIVISCNNPITGGSSPDHCWDGDTDCRYNTEGNAWVTAIVSATPADVVCSAREKILDSNDAVDADDSDCDRSHEIGPGGMDSCTITNTVFFEGIPALNQYGLALLALLMLGIGAVGFRRFV